MSIVNLTSDEGENNIVIPIFENTDTYTPASQIFKIYFDVWNNDLGDGVYRSRCSFESDIRNKDRIYLPKIAKYLIGIESESNDEIQVEIFKQDFCSDFNYVNLVSKITLTHYIPKIYFDNFSIESGYYSIKLTPEYSKISLLYYKPQNWI